MTGLIYSATFGGKDKLSGAFKTLKDVHYLMITDEAFADVPRPWMHQRMDAVHSPSWMNRFLKMNFEALYPDAKKDYRWIIYLDGSITPKETLTRELIESWLEDHEMALFRHPERTDVEEEYRACVQLNKMHGNQEVLRRIQKAKPKGLWAGGMMFRKPMSTLCRRWWQTMVDLNCYRDQVVLPLINTKRVFTIDDNIWMSRYFNLRGHTR